MSILTETHTLADDITIPKLGPSTWGGVAERAIQAPRRMAP